MLEEEVPCDRESNHRSITGFRGQADNAKRSTIYTQRSMCNSSVGNRSSARTACEPFCGGGRFGDVNGGSVHRAPVGGRGLLRGERLLAYRLMDLAQDGVVWNAFSTFIAPLQGQMSRGRTGLLSPNENAWLSVFLGDRP